MAAHKANARIRPYVDPITSAQLSIEEGLHAKTNESQIRHYTRATALAAVANAHSLRLISHALEELLDRSKKQVADYEDLTRVISTRLEKVAGDGEAMRNQLQRLANNITSRR